MTNWKLKLNISKEIQALTELCNNFPEDYIFEGEVETKYMALAKNLKSKFEEKEQEIKDLTEDDGTFEDLITNLEDLELSADIENARYNMENIYEICDVSKIWLEQRAT